MPRESSGGADAALRVEPWGGSGDSRRVFWFALPRFLAGRDDIWRDTSHHSWLPYVGSLALTGLVTIFGSEVERRIAPTNLAMLYLLAVVVVAVRCGRGPALVSAITGCLAFLFVSIPPFRGLEIGDVWYLITLVSLLVVTLLISSLKVEAREQAETARRNQAATAAMYAFSQALASTSDPDQIVAAAGRHIVETFHWPALLALPAGESFAARFRSPGFPWGRDEQLAAEWAFQHGEAAGHGTTNISRASGYYLPLKTAWGIKGVLGVVRGENQSARPSREDPLLNVFASRTALAIGRAILDETARQTELLRRSDKMQQALLNSVSHNLRTPLATITGALQTLLQDGAMLDEAIRHDLLTNAQEQAGRLNRLVANLLDMTRLEAGALKVKRELCDVADVIGAALEQLEEGVQARQISVDMPSEPLLVPLDFALISQVIVNLLDNALKYSPADEPVEIRVRQNGTELEIAVLDYGIGISEQDEGSLFERFQRGSRSPQVVGTGLGLSICRGFVEAHGGGIRAERRQPRGTVVAFTVPMGE